MLPLNLRIRRREEERQQAAAQLVEETKKTTGVVLFEHRTDAKIRDRMIRDKIAKDNKKVREQIDERRARLAALLEAEKMEYEREIEATFETPEQIKEKMFAHARKLKAESEERRRKLAEELENQRFRQSSDILRARASAIINEKTALDRILQLQEKQKLNHLAAEQEARDAAAAETARLAHLDTERVQAEARRRIAAEYSQLLSQQEAAARDLRNANRNVENAEIQRMLDADATAAANQRQNEINRRIHAREEYARTQEYNAKERNVKGLAASIEANADKAALEATLAREAQEEAMELQAKLERRRAGIEFKKQLEAQMAIQEEDLGWKDQYYHEESEKEWTKRQTKWDAEAAARKALMDEVAAGRIAQMSDRGIQAQYERERDEQQLEFFRKTQAIADAKEAEKQAKRKEQLALQAMYSRQQLEENQKKS